MSKIAEQLPCKIGEAVIIRTVTMINVGKIKSIGDQFIVLDDAGWIADTGRYGKCLAEGTVSEYERYPSWTAVGVGSIVDMQPWSHALPQKTV